MTGESDDDIDLSILAPPMQSDEALSSWLVRIADANLITVREMEQILGGVVTGPDRGDLTLLPRIAAMTRQQEEILAQAPLPDLIAYPIPPSDYPLRPGFNAPYCWAVCQNCLEEDRARGVPPYIRRSWTHPLAVVCAEHATKLIAHSYSTIAIASNLTLYGGEDVRGSVFGGVDFDNKDMLARVQRVLDGSGDAEVLQELFKLRRAVSDLIDGLATRMRPPRNEALISIFERTLLGSKMLQGSRDIPSGWWEDLGANTRLFYTRVALRILAEPVDPLEDDGKFPAQTWPYAWYRYSKVEGWQSVFTHAVRDPLFLLPMELPRLILVDLDERSRAWPTDLRRRWTYAVAVGAIGGFVF
jgi:hypothetical protein